MPLSTELTQLINQPLTTYKKKLTELDNQTVQVALAAHLRQLAIRNLKEGQGVVAQGFRGVYSALNCGPYTQFLTTQATSKTWGTYIEAASLGEALGCHVVVTPIKGKTEQSPLCIYRDAHDDAPIIHLYNTDNVHWHLKDNNTIGDGNCLYHAVAQSIKEIAQANQQTVAVPSEPLREKILASEPQTRAGHQQTFFQPSTVVEAPKVAASVDAPIGKPCSETAEIKATINAQRIREQLFSETISQQPKPEELRIQLVAEAERISHLLPKEQQQIKDDYLFALNLARGEFGQSAGAFKAFDGEEDDLSIKSICCRMP